MIEKLTAEQEAQFSVYVDRFLKAGLSTQPFDDQLKAEIVEIMGRIYAAGGLKAPSEIVFCLSPQEALTKAAARVNGCSEDKVTNDMRGAELANFCYGSQDAGWLSFYAFFKEQTAVTGLEIVQPLIDLCGKCSFYLPYENVCFVSQNLSYRHMEAGRLHCTTGPAWAYADGFCGYSLDGVAVPKSAIDAVLGKVKPESVLALQNVEQRLVAIKYVGVGKLLKALNSREIGTKGDVQADGRPEYVLHEVELQGAKEKLLEMQNPSEPKRHYEFVPPEINTVSEALAWRIGWNWTLVMGAFKDPVVKA